MGAVRISRAAGHRSGGGAGLGAAMAGGAPAAAMAAGPFAIGSGVLPPQWSGARTLTTKAHSELRWKPSGCSAAASMTSSRDRKLQKASGDLLREYPI